MHFVLLLEKCFQIGYDGVTCMKRVIIFVFLVVFASVSAESDIFHTAYKTASEQTTSFTQDATK